jgi:zinc protease
MILLPVPSSPLVAFRVQVRVGAADDPVGREGLNALTALSIAGGGTSGMTYAQVIDRLYPLAAGVRAHPDYDVTTFAGQVHRDRLSEFSRLLTDLLMRPRFDASDVRRNRDLLLAAIRTGLRGSDDEELGKEALNAFLFDGHPYGRPTIGTVAGLESITPEDLQAHYRTHYTRGRVRIALAGGFPDEFPGSLQAVFRGLPEGPGPAGGPGPDADASLRALPAPPPIRGLEVLLVEKAVPTAALSIGHPLDLTRADRDYPALLVANSHLGEHRTFNGRLINVMRAARGLNYGDYSYIEGFVQDGGSTLPLPNTPRRRQAFTIWIRPVARHNAAFALRQAVRELALLIERGLTPAEFEAARRFLLNYSRLWTQSLSRRLGYVLDGLHDGRGPLVERLQAELPALRLQDVNAAIRAHLDASRLKVAIVASGARDLEQELLSGRPTPIHYQTPTADPALLKEDEEIAAYPLPIAAERVRIAGAESMFER